MLDSDWFEEIPEEYKRWRAKRGERYWCVKSDGEVCDDEDQYTFWDDKCFSIGNYFKTEEEAQKPAEWLKAFTILRDDTKGFKPDWNNYDQKKWSVEYDYEDEQFAPYCYYSIQNSVIYFATENDAVESIRKHEREWRIFFNCGAEEQE